MKTLFIILVTAVAFGMAVPAGAFHETLSPEAQAFLAGETSAFYDGEVPQAFGVVASALPTLAVRQEIAKAVRCQLDTDPAVVMGLVTLPRIVLVKFYVLTAEQFAAGPPPTVEVSAVVLTEPCGTDA